MLQIDEYKRRNKKRTVDRERKNWWKSLYRAVADPANIQNTLLATFTGALVAVAGLQSVILINQIVEMKDESRPWVSQENAVVWSPLVITDDAVQIVLQFTLENTGKSPARFVSIAGDFFYWTGPNGESYTRDVYARPKACAARRHEAVAGTAVFPGQKTQLNGIFRMEKSDLIKWKGWKEGDKAAITIIGCVDYLFPDGGPHHQTAFIFELVKAGPQDHTFAFVPAISGTPASQLQLAINPTLVKDAD